VKDTREYPSRPMVGAGAVVHRGDRVLLIKRKYPPNEGRWAIPGGLVELGERVEAAAVREVLEETGLRVKVEGLLDVGTEVHTDGGSKVKFHFVLVDFIARRVGGKLKLNQESSDGGWFTESGADSLDMSEGTRKVIRMYFSQRHSTGGRSARRPTGMRSS
jgi:8-oxo-dGTP diphosphatase